MGLGGGKDKIHAVWETYLISTSKENVFLGKVDRVQRPKE